MNKLIVASVFVLLLPVVYAQGYYSDTITGDDSSGELNVRTAQCDSDYGCLEPGKFCYNFECHPCPSAAPACQHYEARGGCTPYPDSDGGACGAPGQFCVAGACSSCWPAGGPCTSDANCCAGVKCDISNGRCVSCDANSVQIDPVVNYGGGKCESSCAASAACDELAVNAYTGLGKCKANCQFCDGDGNQAGCDSCLGAGLWSIGGDISQTSCCGDDSGEAMRFKQCATGICTNDANDKACCTSDTDCVFQGKCYTAIGYATINVSMENMAFCLGKTNQNACTMGEAKSKCSWTGSSCVGAATKEAVQRSKDTNYPAYADINSDGQLEVCVASSPGIWQATSGTISGTVRNVTDPVAGAQIRIIAIGKTAISNSDGTYAMTNVPAGVFELLAAQSSYDAQVRGGIELLDGGSATVDFTLTHSSGDCTDDCTKIGSNFCDQSCQGKGLCWFQSAQIMQSCHGTFGLTELPGGQFVNCCKGAAYSPIKADISVPAKHIITSRKPVLYQGKLLNLVMVLFQR